MVGKQASFSSPARKKRLGFENLLLIINLPPYNKQYGDRDSPSKIIPTATATNSDNRMNMSSYPEFLEEPENFIPFRMTLLLEKLLENRPEEQARGLRHLHRMLADRFHLEFHEKLLHLRDLFIPIDPDRDTRAEPILSPEEHKRKGEEVIREIQSLLISCNFTDMTDEQINQCLTLQPLSGLKVEVDRLKFDPFQISYRGCEQYIPSPNRWTRVKNWLLEKLPVLRKLSSLKNRRPFKKYFSRPKKKFLRLKKVFLLLRPKEGQDQTVILKLYRDVPVENLKIIIPDASIKITIFDSVKIGATVGCGLIASALKLALAAALSWVVLLIFLFTFISSVLKGLAGFINSKTKHIGNCSQELLYQNLSNNIGTISALVTMAEEQEVKETFLAYVELLDHPDRWYTAKEMDSEIEAWLGTLDPNDEYKSIDFEEHDALRKLKEKALVEVRQDDDGQERYRAVDLAAALQRLTTAWTRYTTDGTFGYSENQAGQETRP